MIILLERSIEKKIYHLSNSSNLKLDIDYAHRQGELGRGLYVTDSPEDWEGEQIGERPYLYEVVSFGDLKISGPKDYPSRQQLVEWGLDNGYYEIRQVEKPNGEKLYNDDGSALVRPIETDKYDRESYKDNMTGRSDLFLVNAYMKEKGFDGISPEYSPDGQQYLIWNLDKVRLKRIK